ncbi:MAG: methyl-accepting chemotaxis protein [Mycobacterium leprae]
MRLRLVWRILGAMILVSLVPLGAVGYYLSAQLSTNLTADARQQLTLSMAKASDSVTGFIDRKADVIRDASVLPAVTSMDPKAQTAAIVALNKADKDFAVLHILNLSLMDVARSDGGQLLSFADRPFYNNAINGAAPVYQTAVSKATNKPVLSIVYPVMQGGKAVGVIAGTLNLDVIAQQVSEIKIGKTGYAWLVDENNKVMAHPNAQLVAKQASLADHPAIQLARAGTTSISVMTEGGKRLLTTQRVLPQGWVLVLQMDESEALATATQARAELVRTLLILLVLVLVAAFFLSRSLTRPIQVMGKFVRQMATGDFTGSLQLRRSDEIGEMALGLQEMRDNLRAHVSAVQQAVAGVSGTAAALATAAGQAAQSQAAIDQAFQHTLADVEQATSSQQERLAGTRTVVDELVAAVEQIANSSTHQATEVSQAAEVVGGVAAEATVVSQGIEHLAEVVEQAAGAASQGQSTVLAALDGIRSTKASVDEAAVTVSTLGERSAAIGTILAEITAIADQTNLLALNAAIEAARAGEAGRGFAVVAEEVRRLADRSVRSAQEINQILVDVQAGVSQAVSAMTAGTAAATEGADRANQAQIALEAILSAVKGSAAETDRIRAAVMQLVEGHERLAQSTQSLAAVTEENSAAAEEMAAGSETVKDAVHALDTLAMQNFAAIQGVGQELSAIAQSVDRIGDGVSALEEVSERLAASAAKLKA